MVGGIPEVPEGVEGDAVVVAVRAAQRGLELAHEDVSHAAVLHAEVTRPRLRRFRTVTNVHKLLLPRCYGNIKFF